MLRGTGAGTLLLTFEGILSARADLLIRNRAPLPENIVGRAARWQPALFALQRPAFSRRHHLGWRARIAPVFHSRWVGYAAALAAVGLVSVAISVVLGRTTLANISMLYLAAVLATAVWFGRGPAIVAALAAFLTYDFFFTQPYYTFTVSDPEESVALLFFLATALITGQLVADQHQRAQEASRREREAVVLYDIVRLMSEPDLMRSLNDVAERLRREMQLAAVAIEIQGDVSGTIQAQAGDDEALSLIPGADAARQFLGRGDAPTGDRPAGTGRWIRIVPPRAHGTRRSIGSDRIYGVPVLVRDIRAGTILLLRAADGPRFSGTDDRLLSAAAAQLGIAFERADLRREATEAEVLRRTDELKTALLNAVSHDLRTPLASIITAAGSLLQEDVAWTPSDRKEFAQTIVHESQRLSQIIGNLLDLSRIEAGSLRPERSWYDLGVLVNDVLARLKGLLGDHEISVDVAGDLPPVLVDSVRNGPGSLESR